MPFSASVLAGVGVCARHHLFLPTARSEDRDAFAPELVGQSKCRRNILLRGCGRQIDGLRDAAVTVFLERRLHANMMFR